MYLVSSDESDSLHNESDRLGSESVSSGTYSFCTFSLRFDKSVVGVLGSDFFTPIGVDSKDSIFASDFFLPTRVEYKVLEGPGTRTYVQAHYRISFRYPVHSPHKPANWHPNGSCKTRGPNRSAGARASIHVIYYTLLLISESRSMQTLSATTHHETILSRSPHNLLRTADTHCVAAGVHCSAGFRCTGYYKVEVFAG